MPIRPVMCMGKKATLMPMKRRAKTQRPTRSERTFLLAIGVQ
jgi:hypothetical protein